MAAVLIVLAAALIAWIVTSGGGGVGKKHDDRGSGPAPATSITPGPNGSGPTIGGEPGGRDGSGGGSDGGSGGDDDGGKNGDTAGSGGAGGADGSGATAGSAGSAGTAGSAGSGGSAGGAGSTGTGGTAGTAGAAGGSGAAGIPTGRQVPASSSLPTCGKGSLKVSLTTTKAAYEPDEKPQFKLVVTNSSGTTCKVNLGPKSMVLTITDTEDTRIWTSKDCPKTVTLYFEVPAHSAIAHTVTWDRRHSTTKCSSATPPAAGAGTYLAQISTGVATIPQAQSEKSVRLDQD
ncbi:hypothetical protein [Streptomyces sp. NBC_01497]|uniref:hypothetical protein n=1 Tax=Streptomyces sp. NBC_01497 TaxID=2903885 RepID=UPI002E3071E3|nr:hypothetical protein [Streptomyces sp. NBC_01497]